jgi:hypothetical protein
LGRLHPRDADPTEIAYATKHILTHPPQDVGAGNTSREESALTELRVSLGDWPRALFGEAALRAVAASRAPTECARCRAYMIAVARRLPPPPRIPATAYLLGGCDRCRPKTRGSDARLTSSAAASPPRPSLVRLRAWLQQGVADDPILNNAVRKLLGDQPLPDGPALPPLSDQPVHPSMR